MWTSRVGQSETQTSGCWGDKKFFGSLSNVPVTYVVILATPLYSYSSPIPCNPRNAESYSRTWKIRQIFVRH